jgi:flagellar basal body P-ring protein FlgI
MHSIVITKIQHSKILSRAITYKQFSDFKAKNMVRLLLKYRDYGLAENLVTLLNKKSLMSTIYEDWCAQMLRYSK